MAKRYLLRDKRWEDKSTFLKILGSELREKILMRDKGLNSFVVLLRSESGPN